MSQEPPRVCPEPVTAVVSAAAGSGCGAGPAALAADAPADTAAAAVVPCLPAPADAPGSGPAPADTAAAAVVPGLPDPADARGSGPALADFAAVLARLPAAAAAGVGAAVLAEASVSAREDDVVLASPSPDQAARAGDDAPALKAAAGADVHAGCVAPAVAPPLRRQHSQIRPAPSALQSAA